MPRKSKGRGRGGKGRAQQAPSEPKRPGTSSAESRKEEENKSPQAEPTNQTSAHHEQSGVAEHNGAHSGQASSEALPSEKEKPSHVTGGAQRQIEPPNNRPKPGQDRPSQGRSSHGSGDDKEKPSHVAVGDQRQIEPPNNRPKPAGQDRPSQGRPRHDKEKPSHITVGDQRQIEPPNNRPKQPGQDSHGSGDDKEKPSHVAVGDQRQMEPPNNRPKPAGQDRSSQGRPSPGSAPQAIGLPQGQASVSASTPQPQSSGRQENGRQNGSQSVQVLASAISEERPSHLKQQNKPLPKRPGYGDQGRPIKLKANFFKLDFRGVDFMYHYDVDIKPERTPISDCREIVNCAIDKFRRYFDNHRPAFDGRKNLYCIEKLSAINGDGCMLEITLPGKNGGKDRQFKLTIKYAAEVRVTDLKQFLSGQGKIPQEAVQALDIVLRQIPSLHYTPVGRSFFPTNSGGYDLGGGCEVRTGFYQSVRPSQWKTMLVNIDVSSKGFMKAQPMIDLLCEILQIRESDIANRRWRMNRYMERDFIDAIKGFRVETGHLATKRKYVVMDLGKSAEEHTFKLQDDEASPARMISVKDYFKEKYNLDLRYPHLPCLVVGQKKNYLPMEICNMLESQKRKLTDTQTAEMIKRVTKPAPERQRDILGWVQDLEQKSGKHLKEEYGMSINKNMVDVDGRVLPPPKVTLGNKGTVVPRDGVWDMRNKTFFVGCKVIESWAMVCFVDQRRCNEQVTSRFAKQMENVCRNEGMRMSGNPCNVQYRNMNDKIGEIFHDLVTRYKELQLILVVLPPQGNKDVYKEVKRVGDTVLGIPTQCVQAKQFNDAKPQVCSNIAMKINVKLGGTNHVVDLLSMPPVFKNVIVFGADVTHPSPGESNIPSIAAVVASMDCFASRYAARVRAQVHMKDKSAQEIILDMAAMVKELLVEFYQQTKTKPQRIIFYRDGVSEGQFDQVLLHEVRAVQKACLEIQKDGKYQPPITFVVVQKRHHARLFCVDKKDISGRAGNVPAGTMVDRGITHPFEFDFYLCSHQGIQGTSRPTHYHVLYDDNNFDANSLHKLTYHLCHTYARCTRSVSMPSPAYYAHLVAFRARHHLNGLISSRNSPLGKEEKELLEEVNNIIKVDKKMMGGMYFA